MSLNIAIVDITHMFQSKKGSLVPYLFILFFLFFICSDILLLYLSNISYNGVVAPNSYQKGLEYNKTLAKNFQQIQLGWQGDLNIYQLSGSKIKLEFTLKNKDGSKISGAYVLAKILRPVTDKYDTIIHLDEASPGIYTTNFYLAMPGQWEIQLKADYLQHEFFTNKRISVYF